MPNDRKRPAKTVDLPPRGARNADPITKAPGAHPIEVGAGAALGGAAAGLAAGSLAGPVGAVIGAVAGGVAGGYGGKLAGEALDPTTDTRQAAMARTGSSKAAAAGSTRKGGGTRRAAANTRNGAAARGRSRATGKATARSGDDRRKRGPQDRARINVHESWEVDYWCKRLGVTPAQLRQAVKKAGPMAKDVRRELGK
jgi:hypothetical protein